MLYYRLAVLAGLTTRNLQQEGVVQEGQRVRLIYNRNVCAIGTLKFVGGPGSAGEVTKWGNLTVKRGKCLVSIASVTNSRVRPLHSFQTTAEDIERELNSWDDKQVA